jgi:hypothetical protein
LLDDGDDEAPVQRDRDADVDVLVVADGFSLDRSLDDRVFAQRDNRGAGDEATSSSPARAFRAGRRATVTPSSNSRAATAISPSSRWRC